jgi:hypothetical protein
MQTIPFTIRPKFVDGEALSSYIYRILDLNEENPRHFNQFVNKRYQSYVIEGRDTHHFDIFPERLFDIKQISNLTTLSKEELEDMTLAPLLRKYTDSPSENWQYIARGLFETKYREFCPVCLRKSNVYKLLWQIDDIKLCDIHGIKLQRECPVCKSVQPYAWNGMAKGLCFNCGSKLYNFISDQVDLDTVIHQTKIYENWNLLLDKEEKFPVINGLSKEKVMAICTLYIAQNFSTRFNYREVKYLKNHSLNGFVRLINNKNYSFKVALEQLLYVLKRRDIDVRSFLATSIPNTYIKTLELAIDPPLGTCHAQWCAGYGSNRLIKPIDARFFKFKGETYIKPSYCTGCYMKYGYHKETLDWKEAASEIELIDKVRLFLGQGIKRSEIRQRLNMSKPKIGQIISYLAYHRQLPDIVKFSIPKIPNDLMNSFRKIVKLKGKSMLYHARKELGWSQSDFYYYLATKEVQYFIIFESEMTKNRSHNKKSTEEIQLSINAQRKIMLPRVIKAINKLLVLEEEITLPRLTEILNCKTHHLTCCRDVIQKLKAKQRKEKMQKLERELRANFEMFVKAKFEKGEIITCTNVYGNIGKSSHYVRKYFPKLAKDIREYSGETR